MLTSINHRDFQESIVSIGNHNTRKNPFFRSQPDFREVHHLGPQGLGQRSNLFIEKILSLLPDAGVLPVLQLEQAGEQGLAEHLRALAGQKRRKVIDADHTQASDLVSTCQCDGDSRLIEGSSDRIHRERVVGVGTIGEKSYNGQRNPQGWRIGALRISAHIADDRQTAFR